MRSRITLTSLRGNVRLELFGADRVDHLLVAGGYYAPTNLRSRVFVDEAGARFRAPRLRAGVHLVGGPAHLAMEHPVKLEAL